MPKMGSIISTMIYKTNNMSRLKELKLKKAIENDLKSLEAIFKISKLVQAEVEVQIKANKKFEVFLTKRECITQNEKELKFLDLSPFGKIDGELAFRLHNSLSGCWFKLLDAAEFFEQCEKVKCMGISLYGINSGKLYSLYEDEYDWQYYIND